MNSLAVWKERGKVAALFVLCALMIAVASQVSLQPKLLRSAAGAAVKPVLDETTGAMQDVHASTRTIKDLLAEIKADYETSQNDLRANSEATAVLLRQLTDVVGDLHTQLFGGQDCKHTMKVDCKPVAGLFPQTSLLLEEARNWMTQLKSDTHDLMVEGKKVLESTDADVKELKNELIKLGTLEDSLDQAVKAGSKEAVAIAGKLEASLDNVNILLSDPKISASVDSLAKTTYHFGEIAETTDIATQGLRKKVGRVKWVLNTLANILKGTVRLN